MSQVTIIPADKLGALYHIVKQITTFKLKRDRKAEVNNIARALRGLRLVDRAHQITSIGYGLDSAGQAVLIIVSESATHIQGEPLPQENKK